MMDDYSWARYTERLPATPCTPDMAEQVKSLAMNRGVSMASVQRQAIEFFLQHSNSKSKEKSSNAKKGA
jgi:hypothetical protein